jgi:enolase-phosphatase E1
MTAIRAVVTDIEGTTTPIAFVHEVLFPYARERLARFVADYATSHDVAAALADARALGEVPNADVAETIALLLSWMDEDRKAGPLKLLQGLVWRRGYEDGVLKGQVYDDAATMLARWHEKGLRLFVYSSGSEEAQRLIFGYSDKGDLSPLFDGFFDTRIGAKVEASSYKAIADAVSLDAGEILFLTDHAGEVAAARGAGMKVVRIDRALATDAWTEDELGPVAGSFGPVDRWLDAAK